MKSLFKTIWLGAVFMQVTPTNQALADSHTTVMEKDGIRIEVRTAADRAVFCFHAQQGHKIAAGYGIELDASQADRALWSEPLPKLVSDDDINYFHLPLRIDMKSKRRIEGKRIKIKLGACFEKLYCQVYDFDMLIPAVSDEATAEACRG